MAMLHLLGTGAALSDPHRTTTMLAFEAEASVVLVDCGGDAGQRLMLAGCNLEHLQAVVLTHEHPDHVGGFALLVEKLWVAGRRRPLPIVGPKEALDQAQRTFTCYNTSSWEGLFPIDPRPVRLLEGAMLYADEAFRITSSPGDHENVPVIGLRVEARDGGGVVAYSSDTSPCPSITRLARKADVLVHEATGAFPGHSTAAQAAEVAREAAARRLLLVHLPPIAYLSDDTIRAASKTFSPIERGEEMGRYSF
jgi:ribonuclease Z